ncbi:hypothetical protein OG369_04430 [Streptomyces sp. NBC_01221]|uniref:effector-associated constant component EACC1 n=1 Tax=Streptomyces sp. NBC_01221 TaxID=2903782 RepID=UPI00225A5344|nr:hypothetical protein [Streptomyces sp. NBC_01221]MCX4785448.1 hypothetical protein [Streptomyces sp. NBC_01221]
MQIKVDAEGDEAAAHDLYYWLRQDRELRRHAKAVLTQASETSDRMNAGETINMFVSNGLAAASLLVNIVVAWRAARPSSPGTVTFDRDGTTVTVHDTSEETLRRVVDLLASAPPGGASGTTGAGESSAPSGSGDR